MDYHYILYNKRDNAGYVELNRPEKLNAINAQMRKELIEVFSIMESDPEIKVGVISGVGEQAFSVGADIKEFNTPAMEENWEGWEKVGTLSKPVIAAIHGYCLGGALQMVLRCDLRIASGDAELGLPEVKMGVMVHDGGTQRLSRLVGLTKALEIILTGERISGQDAYNSGLVNKVVPREELIPAVEKMAKSLTQKDPDLLRLCKEAVYKGYNLPIETALKMEKEIAEIANAKNNPNKSNSS